MVYIFALKLLGYAASIKMSSGHINSFTHYMYMYQG